MSAPVHKIDLSPFTPLGRRFARAAIPYVPSAVSPNQITMISFVAYLVAALAFYLAGSAPGWFLVAALAIVVHWLLDELDGELARARKVSSERGFFLDLYLDVVGAAALCFGLALSATMPPLLPLALLVVFLLAAFLSMLHIILRRQFPLGLIGPSESQAFLILLAVVSYVQAEPVIVVAGVALNWFGIGLAAALPVCVIQLLVYSILFYRQLDPSRASP